MMSREQTWELIQRALAFCQGGEAEIIFEQNRSSLSRFANNEIHQNVNENTSSLSVRCLLGKKAGRATTNRLDDEGLKAAAMMAIEAAVHQPEDPSVRPLPGRQEYAELKSFFPITASFGPEQRARIIQGIARACREKHCQGSGAFSSGDRVTALGMSTGAFAYSRGTSCELTLTVMAGEAVGGAVASSKNVEEINAEELGKTAIQKALTSRNPRALKPGKYAVVLEPVAVAGLIEHLAHPGFSALGVQEGRSFLTRKIGQRVFGENITIIDNVYDLKTQGIPFDYEGLPRKRVVLIEKGVARGVVHDRATAARDKVESTGHSLPQPNTLGPIPLNLVVAQGKSTLEEMIASTEQGILVTQVHYANVVDPMKMTITGMTRGGTFWIERGKISHPVKNLRFNQSLVEALNEVEMISRETSYAVESFGVVAPAMKIRAFNFTSGTEF